PSAPTLGCCLQPRRPPILPPFPYTPLFRSHVGRRTGVATGVVLLAGAPAHQVGGLDLDVGFGDGELHALVLADRATEHHAVAGVLGRLLGEPAAVADALGGDQGALGVQAVEDVAEALALFPDQAAGGDFQVVEEQLGGLVIDHVVDRTRGPVVAYVSAPGY